ncbi:MAG: HlyD family efflux transporter periplasmic adaptor subunit [Bacteroidaceae bacterium]|nr:HlyD family efflux transporter periplasmic adaptor subunit [Bacteroidaceae bacterium]MBQ9294601.1 HlyD family efflux transporter periplasmic adaptor subunit [Bacteroidaceae bacterium]
MKKILMAAGAALLLVACHDKEQEYDATGTFEATEITVSAEQSGTLLTWNVDEGDNLSAGQEIGLVDTTQLWLKILGLEANKEVFQSQKPDMEKQIAATRQQLAKAQTEQRRYKELVADGAAPSKMLDDATAQVQVLQRQLDAQVSSLSTTTESLSRQMNAIDVQIQQLRDQLGKCHVVAPIGGTVFEKYVERGEFVALGKPLLKVADTENIFIRAYVTSGQLQSIRVGQKATVFADFGGGQKKEYQGTVSWISNRSEFTPKTILTDDERADLVYAVKVAIRNDGFAKIGMYGEVKF